ncbi:hypothetical protein QLQ80_00175 [Mycoplasma sp. M5725]|uniref:Uncharacterized protein n=1 Tax=Mycoplasma phocimorsus TaxID=3045839 RepID=A0AAJ1UZ97_9MOLU|nr:hypothetical protein [Mycoplasma phocimorsus]MDJ1645508.1 hypothetical protein [Mycoplasma phocimorsus]
MFLNRTPKDIIESSKYFIINLKSKNYDFESKKKIYSSAFFKGKLHMIISLDGILLSWKFEYENVAINNISQPTWRNTSKWQEREDIFNSLNEADSFNLIHGDIFNTQKSIKLLNREELEILNSSVLHMTNYSDNRSISLNNIYQWLKGNNVSGTFAKIDKAQIIAYKFNDNYSPIFVALFNLLQSRINDNFSNVLEKIKDKNIYLENNLLEMFFNKDLPIYKEINFYIRQRNEYALTKNEANLRNIKKVKENINKMTKKYLFFIAKIDEIYQQKMREYQKIKKDEINIFKLKKKVERAHIFNRSWSRMEAIKLAWNLFVKNETINMKSKISEILNDICDKNNIIGLTPSDHTYFDYFDFVFDDNFNIIKLNEIEMEINNKIDKVDSSFQDVNKIKNFMKRRLHYLLEAKISKEKKKKIKDVLEHWKY